MNAPFLEGLRARFNDLVATMSERDRSLFVGLSVFLVLASLGGVTWLGRAQVADARSRVSARRAALVQIEALAAEHAAASREAASIEERIKARAGEDLPAFMEKAAQRAGVATSLASVREREVSNEGTLQDKRYAVELKQIGTQPFAEFLHAVETDGYPLKVRTARIRTTAAGGVKSLNATLEVSAFRLVDAPAAGKGGAP
ncbi:MAG: hypothetical protein RLZZ299_458 [Pseudomonadota bacterium]